MVSKEILDTMLIKLRKLELLGTKINVGRIGWSANQAIGVEILVLEE